MATKTQPIGGGTKKVLYTLSTLQRIGLRQSAKALRAKNTCKACALGMGGQAGGMTNELGEFPSVCNKSVQAQSTDIQPPIPEEVFDHTLEDLQELSPKEIEHMGRLGFPVFKDATSNTFRRISWDEAINLAADRFAQTDPDRTFFYASGRSSNEAAFLFQLVARLYGTNNVSNCSYYCHQATGVALTSTVGTGTATVELADLSKSDLIFVIGANPASNHPRFIHQLKACRDRGGKVIVINPAKEAGLVKFAVPKSPKSLLKGGDEIASLYIQPRIGEDLALFKALAKRLIETGALDPEFIDAHTDGFAGFKADLDASSLEILLDRCGVSAAQLDQLTALYAGAQNAVFAWGMGMTHHLNGVENIEHIANLALMRGMIGRPGAGLLPLRGHSNVQGVGTIGVKPVLAAEIVDRMQDTFGIKLPEKTGLDTMAAMHAADAGSMDAAVLLGGNLFAANPDSAWADRALGKIGFKLSLTTTLNKGHLAGLEGTESLILPVTARDEEWEPTTQESMFNYVRLSDGGINRLDHVRPESVILADFAQQLLPDCPIDFEAFKRHSKLRRVIAEIIPGMEDLADIDVAKREFHIRGRLLHTPVFKTPTGRAMFKAADLPARRGPGQLTLSTVRSEGQFNSIIYETKDSYRGTDTRWAVLMNAEDIKKHGLQIGGKATVKSDHGQMEAVTVFEFDLPSGSVLAYYPEANLLTGKAVDPRSKTPAFKSTQVTIKPA